MLWLFFHRHVRKVAANACCAVGFQEGAGGGAIYRRCDLVARFAFDQDTEAVDHRAAAKYATDIAYVCRFSFAEELIVNGCGQGCELARGFVEDFGGSLVAVFRGLVHQLGEPGYARTREFRRVEAMEKLVDVASAGGIEEERAQRAGRSPTLFEAERSAQGLARDIEAAAFVAENEAPAAGARGFIFRIAAESDGSGSSDDDQSGVACSCAG